MDRIYPLFITPFEYSPVNSNHTPPFRSKFIVFFLNRKVVLICKRLHTLSLLINMRSFYCVVLVSVSMKILRVFGYCVEQLCLGRIRLSNLFFLQIQIIYLEDWCRRSTKKDMSQNNILMHILCSYQNYITFFFVAGNLEEHT